MGILRHGSSYRDCNHVRRSNCRHVAVPACSRPRRLGSGQCPDPDLARPCIARPPIARPRRRRPSCACPARVSCRHVTMTVLQYHPAASRSSKSNPTSALWEGGGDVQVGDWLSGRYTTGTCLSPPPRQLRRCDKNSERRASGAAMRLCFAQKSTVDG